MTVEMGKDGTSRQSPLRPLVEVEGVGLDAQSRCRHWHAPVDIVALEFACCQRWFACHDCHTALAGHASLVWPRTAFQRHAVRCGACASLLTIASYLAHPEACTVCGSGFNPGCQEHRSLYFAD